MLTLSRWGATTFSNYLKDSRLKIKGYLPKTKLLANYDNAVLYTNALHFPAKGEGKTWVIHVPPQGLSTKEAAEENLRSFK